MRQIFDFQDIFWAGRQHCPLPEKTILVLERSLILLRFLYLHQTFTNFLSTH